MSANTKQRPFGYGIQISPNERFLSLLKGPRREGKCPQGILGFPHPSDGPLPPTIFSMRRYARRAINRTKDFRKRHDLFPEVGVTYKIVPLLLHGTDSDDAMLDTCLKVLKRVQTDLDECPIDKGESAECFKAVDLAVKMLKGRKKRRLK